jgi:HAD superfamily hydrolase (TIGR01450 family)
VKPQVGSGSVPSVDPSGLPRAAAGAAWVLDLDGVVWLGGEAIPGAGEAVGLLRSAGGRVLFASNNSSPSVVDLVARLARAGIDAAPDDLVTSGMAAASMLEPGARALVVGDAGVVEALAARGVRAERAADAGTEVGASGDAQRFQAVVVGYTRAFDYGVLARAADAVRAGARLIGTNEDATLPTPDGPLPGAGSILAAVSTASGVEPTVAGKPHQPLATLIAERVGPVAAVVGDRPSTDGALARRLGVPFALVLTGVTARADGTLDPAPAFVGRDLLAVAHEATR